MSLFHLSLIGFMVLLCLCYIGLNVYWFIHEKSSAYTEAELFSSLQSGDNI